MMTEKCRKMPESIRTNSVTR